MKKIKLLMITAFVFLGISYSFIGCSKQVNSVSNGIAVYAVSAWLECKIDGDCCGALSYACTRSGNPVTLDLDYISGLSKAELRGTDTVVVTNTFDKTNLTEKTFNSFIVPKYGVLNDTFSINSALLKAVFADSKIKGFPTDNVIILPGEHKLFVIGNPVNNKITLIQKYYITKNGIASIDHTVQAK